MLQLQILGDGSLLNCHKANMLCGEVCYSHDLVAFEMMHAQPPCPKPCEDFDVISPAS